MALHGKMLIVTGASRGYGRQCVLQWCEFNRDSVVVLIGRSIEQLQSLAKELGARHKSVCVQLDLAQCTTAAHCDPLLQVLKAHKPFEITLVHNAGSLGPLVKVKDLHAHQIADTHCLDGAELQIINISSLAALKTFDCWSVYCSLKAARDHFLRVVAAENPHVKCLSWAPGPLNGTDMIPQVAKEMPVDSPVRQQFVVMQSKRELVEASESARVMWRVFTANEYKSADHLDYYDCCE